MRCDGMSSIMGIFCSVLAFFPFTYLISLTCAVRGLKLDCASAPIDQYCVELSSCIYIYIYIYIYSRSLIIFRDRVYIVILCYILDSCMSPFRHSAIIWRNPSVPLCSKLYWWHYLMAEMTKFVATWLKMEVSHSG